MKQYLIDFFNYNNWANLVTIEAIKQVPDRDEAVKLLSHIINAQNRWLNRITKETDDSVFTWAGNTLGLDELAPQWAKSCNKWIEVLQTTDNDTLQSPVYFVRAADGKQMQTTFQSVVLQVNYHAIHHRAQINTLISKQGVPPPTTDFILTDLHEVV